MGIKVRHFENGIKEFETEKEFIFFVQKIFTENGDEEHMSMPMDAEECGKYIVDFCANFELIYYQPELKDSNKEELDNFFSFMVYLNKENAVKDFPNNKIIEYSENDIEDFSVVDFVEEYNPDLN